MLAGNHVMQVLYKKNFYSMIKSCYARFYMRNMYLRSCYGNFIDTTKNIMLWEIMLWKYHVRRGLAVHIYLTEVAGEGGPDLAPQKFLLSQKFRHLMG